MLSVPFVMLASSCSTTLQISTQLEVSMYGDQTFGIILFIWLIAIGVGSFVGSLKNRGLEGFLYSLFLSWIGVLIIALVNDPKKEAEKHKELVEAAAKSPSGQEIIEVIKVRCPSCKALMGEDAKFCPQCATAME